MEVRWSQLLAAAVKGPEEPGQPEFEQVWLAGWLWFGRTGPGAVTVRFRNHNPL